MSSTPVLHVVLVAPLIPQNVGAVGRLCVTLDADLHLVDPLGFQLTEPRLRRAGLDYWRHLRVFRHDTWEAFLRKARPSALVFFSAHGRHDLYSWQFSPGVFLVFGNEEEGLPRRLWEAYAEWTVSIPMPGPHARSLNLAMAVAVAAYEAWRQLRRDSVIPPVSPSDASSVRDLRQGTRGV